MSLAGKLLKFHQNEHSTLTGSLFLHYALHNYYILITMQSFITLCLGSIGMKSATKGQFYIGIIGKLQFYGHFPIISL